MSLSESCNLEKVQQKRQSGATSSRVPISSGGVFELVIVTLVGNTYKIYANWDHLKLKYYGKLTHLMHILASQNPDVLKML